MKNRKREGKAAVVGKTSKERKMEKYSIKFE
jgi:hypothetical protein